MGVEGGTSWPVYPSLFQGSIRAAGRRTANSGLVLFFLPTHRGIPQGVSLGDEDKLSELMLPALGACLAHKLLAHLQFVVVVSIKNQGI